MWPHERKIEHGLTKIVASGFDAAAGDGLGGCFVTPACYSHMTHMLMTLANGKVAVCLEVCDFFFRPHSLSRLSSRGINTI